MSKPKGMPSQPTIDAGGKMPMALKQSCQCSGEIRVGNLKVSSGVKKPK
jgi:hypothetical protein